MNAIAVIFPGQGSQKVGMVSSFSENFLLKKTFSEASDVLGYNLLDLIECGPVEELNKTYRTQPAILASSVAIWRILNSKYDLIPEFMAGHSLGEYSALVCSGVIDFSSAIKLVELRGIFMQEAVAPNIGAMSVILGLDENIVISVCSQVTFDSNQIVSISAINAQNHIVISGYRKSVENVNIICKKLGAKFVYLLPISVPSHCNLMLPAAKKLQYELEKINFLMPMVSVVNNVDVCIEENVDNIKNALVRQIYTPVRWKEVIEYIFFRCNVSTLIEIGPGNSLSNITKRIVNNRVTCMSINSLSSLDLAIELLEV